MAVSTAEWIPHSCDACLNLDPIKVCSVFSLSPRRIHRDRLELR